MQKTIYSVALLTPVLAFAGELTPAAHAAQNPIPNLRIEELHTALRGAVCRNDWQQAVETIGPLIGSSEITTAYREQLIHFRTRLEALRAARVEYANLQNCRQSSVAHGSSIGQPQPQVRNGIREVTFEANTTEVSLQQRYLALRGAVCNSNWEQALQTIGPMIGSPNISSTYREQLVTFRHQLHHWRAAQARFAQSSSCNDAIASQPTPEMINPVGTWQ